MAASAVPTTLPHRPVPQRWERAFFAGMALVLCAVVFAGFAPTYYRAGLWTAPLPSLKVHVHGALFTLWMLLYLVQTCLVSARRIAWHRTLGVGAFCLAPLLAGVSLAVALGSLHRGLRIAMFDAYTSFAFPLLSLAAFVVTMTAAWRTRRRPEAHRRLILFTMIGLINAALGRIAWDQFGLTPLAGGVGTITLLLLAVVAYDLVTLRRIHRSTAWAAPLVWCLTCLAAPIGMTNAWHVLAGFVDRHIALYF